MHTFFVHELNQLIDCLFVVSTCQTRNLVLVILRVCGIVCISGVIVIILVAFIATTPNVGVCGICGICGICGTLKELGLKELVHGAKELVVE